MNSETHRHTIQLPFVEWRDLRVATTMADRREFTPAWETVAGIRDQNCADSNVTAPQAGIFRPARIDKGKHVTSNEIIGWIDAVEGDTQRSIPVQSPCAGLLTQLTADNSIKVGHPLATIRSASQVFVYLATERTCWPFTSPRKLLSSAQRRALRHAGSERSQLCGSQRAGRRTLPIRFKVFQARTCLQRLPGRSQRLPNIPGTSKRLCHDDGQIAGSPSSPRRRQGHTGRC